MCEREDDRDRAGQDPAGDSPREGLSDAELHRRRRIVVGVAVVALALIVLFCWQYVPGLIAWVSDPAAVRAFVAERPLLSRLALMGINALQIFLAFLPGEPVELAFGYAFGFWQGTALCLVATGLASAAVYLAVRRWGWSIVGLFFDRSQLERYKWLRDSRRLELLMLVVFLIPGTPKDWLTYFAGLTRVRFWPMLAIATLGRIPSIVTSTIAASAVGDGDLHVAVIAVVVAALLAVAGGWAYKRIEARHAEADAAEGGDGPEA